MGEKVTSGSSTTWNDYLLVDGKLVGERTTIGSTSTWQYFILDHLGSVAIVTDGTPGSSTFGKVVTNGRLSFDAWGRQRLPTGYDDPTCSQGLTSPTTRGFTSQEDIAALCLVNLNARLYDPSIGRFLSADSFVADPTDPQAYNRYTYVNNRPLSLTDPTGHFPGAPICAVGWCWNGDGTADTDNGVCTVTCENNGGIRPDTDLQYDRPDEYDSVGNNRNGEFAQQLTCADSACEGTVQRQPQDSNNIVPVLAQNSGENTGAAQNADSSPIAAADDAGDKSQSDQQGGDKSEQAENYPNSAGSSNSSKVGKYVHGSAGPFNYVMGPLCGDFSFCGVDIRLHYRGSAKNLDWVQRASPKSTFPGEDGTWRIDDSSSSNPPFYTRDYAKGPNFRDWPSWSGKRSAAFETSLLSKNANGSYTVIGTVTWSYTYSVDHGGGPNGISFTTPTPITPSFLQQRLIDSLGGR